MSPALPSPSRFRSGVGIAAGVVVAAGMIGSIAAIRHADRTDSSPIVAPEGWLTLYRVSLVAAFAGYVVAVVVLRRSRLRLLPVLALAAAIQLVPLAGPLLLSRDVYFYWDKGRIGAIHDGNPYEDPPRLYPGDPAYKRVGADWRDVHGSYGPVFTLAAEAQADVVGDSPRVATFVYRLVAGLFMVALAVAAAAAAPWPAFAAAFVGWNPLFALHFAGGAHNDVWMIALLLGAFALTRRQRRVLAGVSWLLAVGVKFVPLVLVPLHLARRRFPFAWSGIAAAAAILAALSFWRFGTGWLTHSVVGPNRIDEVSSTSIPYFLHQHVGLPAKAWAYGLLLVFGCVYAVLLVLAWKGRERLALALGVMTACLAWLQPWYVIWPAGMAAIEDDAAAQWLAVALTAWLLRDAVPLW